jgi:aminoglycoside phosphotransferase family enzyme/predicted kinase
VSTEPSHQDLPALLAALASPSAYPGSPERVELIQTHISAVFLAGERVYKLKKELDLGFLDYSTLARRRLCCEAEVSLNRRLAPWVYEAVVPVTREADGSIRVEGEGEVIDWAVRMQRLPESRTFSALLDAGLLTSALVERVGRLLSRFHRDARRGPEVSRHAGFEQVASLCRDNFAAVRARIGETISEAVFARLEAATEAELARRRSLIEARQARGVACDGHGDLRLEHLYQLLDREPPDDLLVVDCVEFSEGIRCGDPIVDLAFLVMDLHGRAAGPLADALVAAYREASGDGEGLTLLPLYTAYRAMVRGKVDGLLLGEEEVPLAKRDEARVKARGRFLLALGELLPPAERPCLVLVGGLPASGKSTAAQLLAGEGFRWIRADVVRKELAGIDPQASARADVDAGIYTPEWGRRTYAECLARAEQALFEGARVVVDASFCTLGLRQPFLEAARRWQVPALTLVCQASPEETRRRLAARADDPSDAYLQVYEAMRARWEPPETASLIDTDAGQLEAGVLAALEAAGLRAVGP